MKERREEHRTKEAGSYPGIKRERAGENVIQTFQRHRQHLMVKLNEN